MDQKGAPKRKTNFDSFFEEKIGQLCHELKVIQERKDGAKRADT